MNDNRTEGAANVVAGRIESAGGEVFDDHEMRFRGAGLQIGGHFQETVGAIQETLGGVADKARAVAATAGDAYGRVSDAARKVDPFVHERPYTALGLCAVACLLLGLLIAGRGPKIIYVNPRD